MDKRANIYTVLLFSNKGCHSIHGIDKGLRLFTVILIGLIWVYFPDLTHKKRKFMIVNREAKFINKNKE